MVSALIPIFASGVGRAQIGREKKAVCRAASVAAGVKAAGCASAGVPGTAAEIGKLLMLPDVGKTISHEVSEPEFLPAEEQIAGIHRAVRQDPELRGPCRTADEIKLG